MKRRIATGNPSRISARAVVLAWLAIATPLIAQEAPENPFDVVGKALRPIANVFAPDDQGVPPRKGLILDAHLVSASKLPPELQGQAVHVAVQTPDKVLIQAPIAGQFLSVCRDGDSFWVTPGSKIQALLPEAAASPAGDSGGKKKKRKNFSKVLGPLVLPVPQHALVFLPVLFQVADVGNDSIAGLPYRVIDVQLMAQLAQSLHAQNWKARAWIGTNYNIARISVAGPNWTGVIAVDKLDLPAQLPPATFQPTDADVLKLTGEQFEDLLERLGGK